VTFVPTTCHWNSASQPLALRPGVKSFSTLTTRRCNNVPWSVHDDAMARLQAKLGASTKYAHLSHVTPAHAKPDKIAYAKEKA
jgi:hypothetical protein